jgi:hypothetical protein
MELVMQKISFTAHPASVGEGYWQHMGMALSFAGALLLAGLACLLHALFPFLCQTTGSRAVTRLYRRMVTHRTNAPAAPGGDAWNLLQSR